VLRQGCPPAELTERLGVTSELWEVSSAAYSLLIVALTLEPGRGCLGDLAMMGRTGQRRLPASTPVQALATKVWGATREIGD